MLDEQLLVQIRTLEVQLAVLKARYQKRLLENRETFADLYGFLKDKVQSTDEEIEEALFRFEWEEKNQ